MQYKKTKGFPEIELHSQFSSYMKSIAAGLDSGSLPCRNILPSLESLQKDLDEIYRTYLSYSPEGTEAMRSSMLEMLQRFRRGVSLMKEYAACEEKTLLKEACDLVEEGSEMLISLQLVLKESQEMIKDI